MINTPPTWSCQAASSRRTGNSEAERIVRNNTISTHPARAMPRAVLEGSEAKELELDDIRPGSREEKTEQSTDDRSRQKSPSQAEKGWVSQQASLQAVALILHLSRRLQPKAAPAPKRGRGAGTDAGPTGAKLRVFEGDLSESALSNEPNS